MSDFDTVLERLVADPAFAAALSADPAGALAGYRLSADEIVLLRCQVTGDAGGQSAVETRANQSSVFGLLAPLTGLAGVAGAFEGGRPAAGPAPGPGGHGGGLGSVSVPGQREGFGAAPGYREGFGPAPGYRHGFGAAPGYDEGFGAASAAQGFGPAAEVDGFGAAQAPTGSDPGDAAGPPPGYQVRVDTDGDGRWDRHTARGRADGGVDIFVDGDADGRIDFVGHDTDADGLVNSAQFDRDGDGFLERRSYDDDGDGWLDRDVDLPGPPGRR